MAGLLKPAAVKSLVYALKQETGLPLHLHTHDTSGIAGATILAAVEAGVDAVDCAMDAMSGTTSQACLGSIVEALRGSGRDTMLDPDAIRRLSFTWEAVRTQYAAFESDLKSGASEVYLHEMPGGQFTNLKEQARSLGLEARWHEVAAAYRAANDMFGDIVKVTPSSKVVGDMALAMVSQNLTTADVLDPARDIAFPASVVEMLHGDLGQPPGGWPPALQAKALKGETPIHVRSFRRTHRGRKQGRAQALRHRFRILADVPEGVCRLRGNGAQIWPGRCLADAGVFLRDAAGRGDRRRDRARQDAGRAPHRLGRYKGRRHGRGVL
jgi:pyruvate carboxylase